MTIRNMRDSHSPMEMDKPTNRPNPRHDYLEGRGANILADMIRDYWSDHPGVKVWVERCGNSDNFGVRSNLVNGNPPRVGLEP